MGKQDKGWVLNGHWDWSPLRLAHLPRLPLSPTWPCQEPAVETHPSADTEEETLRRRLEELTSKVSGSETSSEDETKPDAPFRGVSPKVRPPLRSQTKHGARGTIQRKPSALAVRAAN